MKETEIKILKEVKLNNPILLVGLPGIGNVGRVAIGYMVHKLNAEKFAELYSPSFYPSVLIHNNAVHLLRNEFYYWKNPKGRDLILLIGDMQTYDPKAHYEIAGKIVDFAISLGVKEIITIGGFGTGTIIKKPKVYGVLGNQKLIQKYKDYGINFNVSDKIGMIIGAAGLIVGLGNLKNIDGIVLLGETSGIPILTDPSAAESVLEVLQKIININIDLTELEEKAKAMNEFIKKLDEIQRRASEEIQKGKKTEEVTYIG
ncbi:MAG: proteasome assembly chaperone family protein [Candidatus Aenigmatarchaeota archaeon]|nr:proteasome assembly chaperone family protein [Candidatus Aenigmarchaeota archaeon]